MLRSWSLYFEVPGEPVAWQRVAGAGNRSYVPAKTKAAKDEIGYTFKEQYPNWIPLGYDMTLDVTFHTKSKTKDIDNLCKTVLDALTKIMWIDDRQVVKLRADIDRSGEYYPHTSISIFWERDE